LIEFISCVIFVRFADHSTLEDEDAIQPAADASDPAKPVKAAKPAEQSEPPQKTKPSNQLKTSSKSKVSASMGMLAISFIGSGSNSCSLRVCSQN
jgi:hypothetical protein